MLVLFLGFFVLISDQKKSKTLTLLFLSHQWYPEVNHFCHGVPVVLIGCKTDLRKDKELLRKLRASRQEPITYNQVTTSAFQAVFFLQELKRAYFNGIIAHKCNPILQNQVITVSR